MWLHVYKINFINKVAVLANNLEFLCFFRFVFKNLSWIYTSLIFLYLIVLYFWLRANTWLPLKPPPPSLPWPSYSSAKMLCSVVCSIFVSKRWPQSPTTWSSWRARSPKTWRARRTRTVDRPFALSAESPTTQCCRALSATWSRQSLTNHRVWPVRPLSPRYTWWSKVQRWSNAGWMRWQRRSTRKTLWFRYVVFS